MKVNDIVRIYWSDRSVPPSIGIVVKIYSEDSMYIKILENKNTILPNSIKSRTRYGGIGVYYSVGNSKLIEAISSVPALLSHKVQHYVRTTSEVYSNKYTNYKKSYSVTTYTTTTVLFEGYTYYYTLIQSSKGSWGGYSNKSEKDSMVNARINKLKSIK